MRATQRSRPSPPPRTPPPPRRRRRRRAPRPSSSQHHRHSNGWRRRPWGLLPAASSGLRRVRRGLLLCARCALLPPFLAAAHKEAPCTWRRPEPGRVASGALLGVLKQPKHAWKNRTKEKRRKSLPRTISNLARGECRPGKAGREYPGAGRGGNHTTNLQVPPRRRQLDAGHEVPVQIAQI